MSEIRDKAKTVLDKLIPAGAIYKSNSPNAKNEYEASTGGFTQAAMEENWYPKPPAKPGKMTGCNRFTGWYAAQLGSTANLGVFELEDKLHEIGKGHAWVKSRPGIEPQPGDILRHTILHVDVAIEVKDKVLHRAAAGQGGRDIGYDILKRVKGGGPFSPANLLGWVDIDLYFSAVPSIATVPSWLLGWWKISWRSQPFYYFFDRSSQVIWTRNPPTGAPPLVGGTDSGAFTVERNAVVTIRWKSGSVEKLERLAKDTTKTKMSGTWNDKEPLFAAKAAITAGPDSRGNSGPKERPVYQSR